MSAVELWFTLGRPVDRLTYLKHGVGLVLVKYVVDATLIGFSTGRIWLPHDYLGARLLIGEWAVAPSWLPPVLLLWTIPFLWIGATMTLRRLVDMGASPWYSILFFVPVVGYVLILVLAVRDGCGPRRPFGTMTEPSPKSPLAAGTLAIALGTAFGLNMILLNVLVLEGYGLALFMGTPFGIGLISGYVYSRGRTTTGLAAVQVAMLAALLSAAAAFGIGIEGVVCLLMLAPLGLLIAAMGALIGRSIAGLGIERARESAILLAIPLTAWAEGPIESGQLLSVTTSVVVEAPPEIVWDALIEFPPMEESNDWLFRMGVAEPRSARIDGTGVGAVRYCTFTTGSFVEPITLWQPGVVLGFDVVESPPPLVELTPYSVSPPHLDGYLVARRGEFRIQPLDDGSVMLTGTTWYEQRLRPVGYWGPISEFVIGKVHRRVLDHIRAVVIGSGNAPAYDP